MKFRFRGGGDCPDWLLGEINSMSAFRPEDIRSMSRELMELQLNSQISREEGWKRLQVLLSDGEKEEDTLKAVSAALTYILVSSAKFQVHGPILLTELQQLGLPREHALSILDVYEERGPEIRDRLKGSDSLILNPKGLTVSCSIAEDKKEVHLKGLDPSEPLISLTPNAFASLLRDLRDAEGRMKDPSF